MGKKKIKPAEEKQSSQAELKNVLLRRGMLARALADYDNLSKRVDRERADLGKLASVGIVVKLLPVLDGLESARTS